MLVESDVISNSRPVLRLASPGVVDDRAAHHPGRVAHEAVAIGKRDALATRDVQVRLVQQRGRPERHARRTFRQLTPRHAMQLVVERGVELVRGVAIALLGGSDE
jgi:hypothetical protein